MGFIKTIVLFPGNFVLLLALAGLWTIRYPGHARGILAGATALLWVISTPAVGQVLIGLVSIETQSRLGETQAGAIITLGGDFDATTNGGAPGPLTLERLARAAVAHRATGLPILVTAGRLEHLDRSGAEIMAQSLEYAFDVPVRWLEENALSTQENAYRAAEVLERAGVGKALLVTHRWHLRRARLAFEQTNLEVELVSVHSARPHSSLQWRDVMPTFAGLEATYYAGYELLGYVWYRLRG